MHCQRRHIGVAFFRKRALHLGSDNGLLFLSQALLPTVRDTPHVRVATTQLPPTAQLSAYKWSSLPPTGEDTDGTPQTLVTREIAEWHPTRVLELTKRRWDIAVHVSTLLRDWKVQDKDWKVATLWRWGGGGGGGGRVREGGGKKRE